MPAPNSGVTDVLGNHISMTLTAMMTVGEQVKAGQLMALAVTSTERNPVFKGIPTFAEQGYPDVRGIPGSGCADRRACRPKSSTSSARPPVAS